MPFCILSRRDLKDSGENAVGHHTEEWNVEDMEEKSWRGRIS